MSFDINSRNYNSQTPVIFNSSPKSDSSKKNRILIVDDSATVRKVLANRLSARYICEEAGSVAEALACLADNEFVLIIADVIMPGLSGIELLRKVVENFPFTAVIMVSGVDQPQRALDAVRLGAFDYLIKPCDLDVLEFTVERALERRALLDTARQYKLDLEVHNAELARGKAELERLQAQIVHSEKMASLGQLAAGIAHEINNPVGFVYGNLDILNNSIADLLKLLKFYDETELPDETALKAEKIKTDIGYDFLLKDLDSIIGDCKEGAERIRDIVQNLRTFSRLDEADLKRTDLHEGIDSTIRLLSRYFSDDKIKLIKDYGNIPQIEAFSGQLNQVWMNILANAAQAIGTDGGAVRIATRTDGTNVTVAISDTGNGIAEEHLSRIFDPFFTTKRVGEGTGLGLSISFGIVERHGGTISVKTQEKIGTTFRITLPIFIKAKDAFSG